MMQLRIPCLITGRFFRFCLLLAIVVLAQIGMTPVSAQTVELPLRIVATTPQGITFYERTVSGTLQPVGEPLSDFAVETYGGNAEWLILSKESFAVSPDGQRIAFTAKRGDEAALFIYMVHNNSLTYRPIVSYWLMPTWSPDSEAVLLALNRYVIPYTGEYPPPDDYVYEIATDSLSQITFTVGIEWVFHWSADGKSILYFGWCHPDPCGNPFSDLYLVSRDGANRFALTDFSNQLPANTDRDACSPTWSRSDRRWYYEVGCNFSMNTPFQYVYSTDLSGNNRLEVDLENYIQSTDGAGIGFRYGVVEGIHARSEGIYISVEVSFYPDFDLYPDLPDASLNEWRVLRLTGQGQLQTVYRLSILDLHGRRSVGLTGSVISPTGQFMAMLYSFDSVYIVDLVSGQNVVDIPGEGIICDVRWLDNETLVYNFGGKKCEGRYPSGRKHDRRLGVATFNITTSAETLLTAGLEGSAWALPTGW